VFLNWKHNYLFSIVMNFKQHFIVYFTCWLIFSIYVLISIYLHTNFVSIHFIGLTLLTFVISNPDLDQLVDLSDIKSFFTETKEMDNHRSFFTHSVFLPLIFYWLIRYYLDMNDSNKILEFGLGLFLPVLIHLMCDYQVGHLIGTKGTSGTWLITFHPIDKIIEDIVNTYLKLYNLIKKPKKLRKMVNYKARLTKNQSFIYIVMNMGFIVVYIYFYFIR